MIKEILDRRTRAGTSLGSHLAKMDGFHALALAGLTHEQLDECGCESCERARDGLIEVGLLRSRREDLGGWVPYAEDTAEAAAAWAAGRLFRAEHGGDPELKGADTAPPGILPDCKDPTLRVEWQRGWMDEHGRLLKEGGA